jgi:hypothetical protein
MLHARPGAAQHQAQREAEKSSGPARHDEPGRGYDRAKRKQQALAYALGE